MKKLVKEQYSLFSSCIDKKIKKDYLIDFAKSLSLLYNIKIIKDYYAKDINNETIQFLIDLGVINVFQDVLILKEILKEDYQFFLNIICNYIDNHDTNNIDPLLIKYMDKYRKLEVEKYLKDSDSPTVIDFFCGAGGMSLGFKQNGYKILLANDIESVCTTTYAFNHPEIPQNKIITGDIKDIVENVDNFVSEKVDVIIGGPPCQGFSMANRQRIIDDPRNRLYKYYLRGVEKMKPKFFVMENVKGMLTVADQVKEDFHNLKDVDYDVSYCLLNAKDFSVPQNRERLIYIGVRKDHAVKKHISAEQILKQIIDESKNLKQYCLNDAIGDLKELKAFRIKNSTDIDSEESGKKIDLKNNQIIGSYVHLINNYNNVNLIYNHKARYNNERDIEIYSRMHQGDKSDSERIKDIMPYKNRSHIFKDKYFKLISHDICKTITAHMKFDCNMYIHPFQARGLTPREAARVQSYPDDYFFQGAFTKTYMQIGNSVPPLMSRYIAKIIKKFL